MILISLKAGGEGLNLQALNTDLRGKVPPDWRVGYGARGLDHLVGESLKALQRLLQNLCKHLQDPTVNFHEHP